MDIDAFQQSESDSALFQLTYRELRKLAAARMARERDDHTLTATALVHEVWLRLSSEETPPFRSRSHFLAAASEAMRRILVDSYRRRSAQKRGGDSTIRLHDVDIPWADHHEEMLIVNEELERLQEAFPRQAGVFKMRCFGGVGMEEIAEVLDVSPRTVANDWSFAKAWLGRKLAADAPEAGGARPSHANSEKTSDS